MFYRRTHEPCAPTIRVKPELNQVTPSPLAYNLKTQIQRKKVVNLESQAEPKVVTRIGLANVAAINNARASSTVVLAAATSDAARARAGTAVIVAILVRSPFPYVTRHIIDAKLIRLLLCYGKRI